MPGPQGPHKILVIGEPGIGRLCMLLCYSRAPSLSYFLAWSVAHQPNRQIVTINCQNRIEEYRNWSGCAFTCLYEWYIYMDCIVDSHRKRSCRTAYGFNLTSNSAILSISFIFFLFFSFLSPFFPSFSSFFSSLSFHPSLSPFFFPKHVESNVVTVTLQQRMFSGPFLTFA